MDINIYIENAIKHEKYCKKNCGKKKCLIFPSFPHTKKCIKMANLHGNSFIECKSSYCTKYLEDNGFIPSHKRYDIQKVGFEKHYLEYAEFQDLSPRARPASELEL